jgi:hypothetical protein
MRSACRGLARDAEAQDPGNAPERVIHEARRDLIMAAPTRPAGDPCSMTRCVACLSIERLMKQRR